MPKFRWEGTRVVLSEVYRLLATLRQHDTLSLETRTLITKVLTALDKELALRPLDVEPTQPGPQPDFRDDDPTTSDKRRVRSKSR